MYSKGLSDWPRDRKFILNRNYFILINDFHQYLGRKAVMIPNPFGALSLCFPTRVPALVEYNFNREHLSSSSAYQEPNLNSFKIHSIKPSPAFLISPALHQSTLLWRNWDINTRILERMSKYTSLSLALGLVQRKQHMSNKHQLYQCLQSVQASPKLTLKPWQALNWDSPASAYNKPRFTPGSKPVSFLEIFHEN